MGSTVNSETSPHMDDLLDRVERGERVALARDGRHVATLIPATWEQQLSPAASENGTTLPEKWRLDLQAEAIARLRAQRERILREGGGVTIAQILEARDEGRK